MMLTASRRALLFVLALSNLTQLSSAAEAVFEAVDPYDWLNQCVPPFQQADFAFLIPYSNFDLIDEPAGLCADFLACAFEYCIMPEETIKLINSTGDASTVSSDSGLLDSLISGSNDTNASDVVPQFNLPAYISFPKNAKDVVSLVKTARENCWTISIKNGGHSHHGASTMKDSLQLNLRNLQGYANSSTGIIQCMENNVTNVDEEPSRACRAAVTNGKTAVIRVGGGEVWDYVYRAVLVWNGNQTEGGEKYDVVGGGAGSVSAIGGWMQGGGLSIGDERMYGLGVDNVLELQMVLADGSHVKFGPTEWMEEDGTTESLYPRVTKIEGRCNQNVSEEESDWEWGACPEGTTIPFDKLWKAVRGGGGGTYGIVTSAYYQLHPQKPLFRVFPSGSAAAALFLCAGTPGCLPVFGKALAIFLINVLYDPEAVGLDEETSMSCGSPTLAFDIGWNLRGATSQLLCRNPEPVVAAWGTFLEGVPELQALGPDFISAASGAFEVIPLGSYAEGANTHDGNRAPLGRLPDEHPPATQYITPGCWSILLPEELLKLKTDEVLQLLAVVAPAHVIGGRAAVADPDSQSAVPHAERMAGYQGYLCPVPGAENLESDVWSALQAFQPENLPAGEFFGGSEYNHIDNVWYGPLKTNHTESCPLDLSMEEKEEQCVSVVETVFGTSLLAELEEIKKEVDPNNMFKCYRCVGEKQAVTCATDAPTPVPAEMPMPGDGGNPGSDPAEPTPAPTQPSFGPPTPPEPAEPPSSSRGITVTAPLLVVVGGAIFGIYF